MQYIINRKKETPSEVHVSLPASKSISNRALILNALSHSSNTVRNLAHCDDTDVLDSALKSHANPINIGAAGTAMRFLTAYLCMQKGEWEITGSERMKQRPIEVLVNALRTLGATIDYQEKEGFPPLKIKGQKLSGGKITIQGNVSSQYISALLMIAPTMENGLELQLTGEIISKPYILMTLKMMESFGVKTEWTTSNSIIIPHQVYQSTTYSVESDWSAASYWYEIATLGKNECVYHLPNLYKASLQGDCKIQEIFQLLGIQTTFTCEGVDLQKITKPVEHLDYDFTNQPDLAQTVVVTCCALDITFRFTGLQSLKIKETDRIEALKNECKKLGYVLKEGELGTLYWNGEKTDKVEMPTISTYNDHRMAMAFAPAALKLGTFIIENPEVVTKSYPDFWVAVQAILDRTEQ